MLPNVNTSCVISQTFKPMIQWLSVRFTKAVFISLLILTTINVSLW